MKPIGPPPRTSAAGPRHAAARLLGSLLGTCLAALAQAGPLADPTRPPAAAAQAAAGPDAARARPQAPVARAALPAAPLPVLQSVQMPARGPAVALVDGQLVQAGDTVGGRVIKSIDPQGMTLAGRTGSERVLLLGGPAKQAAGSIATTHATRFEPAPVAPADTLQRADRPGLALPSPTTPVPLSVAGRTAP